MCDDDNPDLTSGYDLVHGSLDWINSSFLSSKITINCDFFSNRPNLPELPLSPDHVDVCIFHSVCHDGTAAAYAVGRRYPTCEFFGVNRGSGDTDLQLPDGLAGKHVMLVDYVYPEHLMVELIETAASVWVVDHHTSEEELLKSLLPSSQVVFSPHFSAAILTWVFLHGDSVPPLIGYIDDNDVGRWALPNIGKFVSGFSVHSPAVRPGWGKFSDFDQFGLCIEKGETFIKAMIVIGVLASDIEWRDVYSDAQRSVERRLRKAPKFSCRVLNVSPSARNGALSRALLRGDYEGGYPADISILYYYVDANGTYKLSLRAADESSADIGEIAGMYGGGGHGKAGSISGLTGGIDELFLTPSEQSDYEWNLRLEKLIDEVDIEGSEKFSELAKVVVQLAQWNGDITDPNTITQIEESDVIGSINQLIHSSGGVSEVEKRILELFITYRPDDETDPVVESLLRALNLSPPPMEQSCAVGILPNGSFVYLYNGEGEELSVEFLEKSVLCHSHVLLCENRKFIKSDQWWEHTKHVSVILERRPGEYWLCRRNPRDDSEKPQLQFKPVDPNSKLGLPYFAQIEGKRREELKLVRMFRY
jgi:uncharacterized protein